MYRVWEVKGPTATVTYFDKGNGWSSIETAKSPTPEAWQHFLETLWDQVLTETDNSQKHRNALSNMVNSGHCPNTSDCACAKRVATLKAPPSSA